MHQNSDTGFSRHAHEAALRQALCRALALDLGFPAEGARVAEPAAVPENQPWTAEPEALVSEFSDAMSLETWRCVVAHIYADTLVSRDPAAFGRLLEKGACVDF